MPVRAHCAAKCFCDRRATSNMTTIESGTVTRATAASRGLIQTMTASTPTMVSVEVRNWLMPCCKVVVMLSMSLVTRLSMSPWAWLSKCCSGRRASLASASRRGQEIDERGQRQDLTELREVDTTAGHDVGPRHQVGDLAMTLCPEAGDRLLLGDPGGQTFADDAVEDHVRRVADDLRTDDAAGDATQREDGRDDDPHTLRLKPRQ